MNAELRFILLLYQLSLHVKLRHALKFISDWMAVQWYTIEHYFCSVPKAAAKEILLENLKRNRKSSST